MSCRNALNNPKSSTPCDCTPSMNSASSLGSALPKFPDNPPPSSYPYECQGRSADFLCTRGHFAANTWEEIASLLLHRGYHSAPVVDFSHQQLNQSRTASNRNFLCAMIRTRGTLWSFASKILVLKNSGTLPVQLTTCIPFAALANTSHSFFHSFGDAPSWRSSKLSEKRNAAKVSIAPSIPSWGR